MEAQKEMMRAEEMHIEENKMGTMPVNKLLLNMSIPMIVSMLIQALYNVVDSIFVSRINENALSAVSLVFPVQSIMIAVATGTCVGVNAILSKRLGEKKMEEANKTANVAVLLSVLSYFIFLIVGIFGSRLFFEVQVKDAQVIEYGESYMSIVCIMSFGLFLQVCFERLLQSTGRTFYTMIVQGVGAVINLIMDPILIFGLFGFPKMGIAGAAVATVAGQIVGMILGLIFNLKANKEIHLNIKEMNFNMPIIKEIYKIGIPAILMQSIGSVMVFLMNKILLSFTLTAAAVFGIFYKLQSLVFMPIFGLSNGMIPIIAYNYGAKKKERMIKTVKYSMVYAVVIMLLGMLIAELVPGTLLLLFDASESMLTIGIPALRILCTCFALAGFNIIASSMFQALGNSMYSLIMSVIRQVLVLLPVAWLLSLTGILDAVWLSFPIAEVVSTVVAIVLLKKTLKKINF